MRVLQHCHRGIGAAFLALVIGLFTLVPVATGEGELDQSTGDPCCWAGIIGHTPSGGDFELAQTFTAGKTGYLDTVAFWVVATGSDGRFSVTLSGVKEDGSPSDASLASTTYNGCRGRGLRFSDPPPRVTLSPAPSITAGQRYAVRVAPAGGPSHPQEGRWDAAINELAGGASWVRDRSTSAPVWIGYGSGSSKPLSLYTYVSAVQPPTVTLRPTTTALTATPTTIKRYGRVKLAAAVADPVAPDAAPTGDVTFYVDGAPEATVDLDAAGKAEHTITLGTVGEHSVDAAYCPGADSTYVSSEDEAAVTVTSEKWATATVAEVTPDPSVAWQPATLAATLSQPEGAGPTITGSIQFAEDDGTPIGEPVPLDQDGRAELTAGAGAGDYVVRAHYSGDELNAPSDGTATQHVDRQTTTATIDSSDNPAVVGEPFTLYALVEADPPSEGTPSGEVQFTIDGTPAGAPLPLDDSASIAVDVVARQPGRAVIGVRYSGDDDYFASAAQFTETVQPAPTPATSTPPPPGAPPLASPAPRPLTSRQLLSALRVPRTITVRDTRPFRFAKLTSTRVRSLTVELFAKRRATAGRAAKSRTRWLRVGRGRSSGTVVTARLTRAGVRLLRRTRKLRVQARIRAIDDTGATVTATMNRMLQRGARARGSQG